MTPIRVRTLIAVTAATLALSGCGLDSGEDDSGADTEGASDIGAVEGDITFTTLQLKPTFTEYIEGVIADFEEQNPGTSVEWIDIPFEGAQEKIATDAAAGTLADVVNLNPNFAQPLIREGMFLDLTDVTDTEDRYVQGAWDAFKVPGEDAAYGFPWYLTSEVTMYNTELFEQAGLDPATPPATLEELYAAAEKIAATGAGDFYGLHPALENRFIRDLAQLGVPLLNDAGDEWTFNTPEAVAHVEELTRLYSSGVMPPDSLTQDASKQTEAYQAGKIALFPSGPNFLELVRENAPDIAEVTDVGPQITGENGVTNLSVMGVLVPESSDNRATAIAFSEFLTNGENQLAFSKIVTIFPSVIEALEDPYFTDDSDGTLESKARRISAEQVPNGQNLTPVQFDDRVKAVVIGKVQLAMAGDLSAQEALDQAVEEANAITQAG